MNEDLGNPSRICFRSRVRIWVWRYSDCWDWRIGKVGSIRNYIPEDWMRKKFWQPKKTRFYSCHLAAEFSNVIRKRLRTPRTHSETGIHRKGERISTENLMSIGKSFDLKKTKDDEGISKGIFGLTQKLWKNLIYCHHVEPWSSTYVPKEESFLIYIDLSLLRRNSSEKKYTMRTGNWKSRNI